MLSLLLTGAGIWVAGKVLAVLFALGGAILLKMEAKGSSIAGCVLVGLASLSALGAWIGLAYYIIQAIKL